MQAAAIGIVVEDDIALLEVVERYLLTQDRISSGMPPIIDGQKSPVAIIRRSAAQGRR